MKRGHHILSAESLARCAAVPINRKAHHGEGGKPKLRLPPVRDRIFSSELRSVAASVIGHGSPSEVGSVAPPLVPVDAKDILRPAELPYAAEYVEAFQNLYSQESPSDDAFHPLLDLILQISGADGAVFLSLEGNGFTYAPVLARNIDDITIRNLRFAMEDPYLDTEVEEHMLRFDGHLVDDLHFRKRFGTDFFQNHAGAVFLNLRFSTFQGLLALFFADALPAEPVAPRLREVLSDLLPAVTRKAEKPTAPYADLRDLTEQQFVLLKNFAKAGRMPMHVIRVDFPEILGHASGPLVIREICEVILRHLWMEERLIIPRMDEIIVLAMPGRPAGLEEAIQAIAARFGMPAVCKTLRFPEDGHNLFNFI